MVCSLAWMKRICARHILPVFPSIDLWEGRSKLISQLWSRSTWQSSIDFQVPFWVPNWHTLSTSNVPHIHIYNADLGFPASEVSLSGRSDVLFSPALLAIKSNGSSVGSTSNHCSIFLQKSYLAKHKFRQNGAYFSPKAFSNHVTWCEFIAAGPSWFGRVDDL
jgi:hypothetical protein